MNNLELTHSEAYLKAQNLQLTELEGTLIAKNIVFMKLLQLPKSRWGKLTDKIINVPVTDESINNTLCQLPRTPDSANMIEKFHIEYDEHKDKLYLARARKM